MLVTFCEEKLEVPGSQNGHQNLRGQRRTVFKNCKSSKDDSTIARLFVTRPTSRGSSGAGLLQLVVIAGTDVILKLMWSEPVGVGWRLGSFLGLGHGGVDR